jgi:hypothetical protein
LDGAVAKNRDNIQRDRSLAWHIAQFVGSSLFSEKPITHAEAISIDDKEEVVYKTDEQKDNTVLVALLNLRAIGNPINIEYGTQEGEE